MTTPRAARRSFAAVLLSLAVPATATAAASAHVSRAGSTTALMLNISDVLAVYGTGFKAAKITVISNAVVNRPLIPGLKAGDYARHGRITGYLGRFDRTGVVAYKNGKFTVKRGVAEVVDAINAYSSNSGPIWEFALINKQKLKAIKGVSYHIAPFSGLGEQALVETYTARVGGGLPPVQGIVFLFRHGAFTSSLSVSGYSKPKMADAVRLAQMADARLSHR